MYYCSIVQHQPKAEEDRDYVCTSFSLCVENE